jgi:hypothetical protein
MQIPGFSANDVLLKVGGRYRLLAGYMNPTTGVSPATGCGPCVNGEQRCCFGFDPETRGPICETRSCTSPPPPPPPGCLPCTKTCFDGGGIVTQPC